MVGQKLGPYEVLAKLGEGGMGEVYKARDTRLDRTVAIKVLPSSLASDSQFRERFDREARAISQLDHPHICALHDVGEHDGIAYLVMQYLEGETLASRLATASARRDGSGLPLDQALAIAIQVAGALDSAHRAGIVHRDLKPGNVMLTSAGAKLLDFGLAKSSPASVAAGGASMLPTTPPGLTAQGAILGTLQYMAPEQLEGGLVDARTDIFAFGALVHEMCTGKRAFEAKSNAGLVAAILEHEPVPISRVQPLAPAALDRVVKTCLAKHPDDRWQSARDLLRELEWIADGRASPDRGPEPTVSASRRWLTSTAPAWGVAVVSLLGIAVVLLMRPDRSPQSPSAFAAQTALRLSVTLPDGARLVHSSLPALALSSDGTRLAYVAERQGVPRLYLRHMDTFETREVPDSEGAVTPFFSPDGQWVGFASGGKLKKVSTSGGQPIALADAVLMWGATWGADDTIVFGQNDVGLSRVSSSGGQTTGATTLDPKANEGGHLWPHLLPDGKSMLLTVGTVGTNMERARIVLHSLETGKRRVLIEGGSYAQYVASGHIVYGVGGSLMAAPFDLASGTITGGSVPVFHGVTRSDLGVSQFSVARTGAIVFAPGPIMTPKRTLSWVDRTGTEIPLPLPTRAYWPPRLSPDGRRLAVGIEGPSHDIWISEVDRDALSRLTSGADSYWPIWTGDGSRIIFQSNRTGQWNIFWIPVDRTGPGEQLVRSDRALGALFTFSEGRELLYGDIAPGEAPNFWSISLNDPRSPRLLERWKGLSVNPILSPDGRWIAYGGNDSGQPEIYVQRFPEGGLIRQVTRDGGVTPAWSRNGRELFYVANDRVKVVEVTPSGTELAFGRPRDLFKIPFPLFGPGVPLEVTPDGQRFLFVKQGVAEPGPTQINFVQGWQAK